MISSLLLSLALCGAPQVDAKLVGSWALAGRPFITLNADGTGAMEGARVKWTADGKTLVVTGEDGTPDKLSYHLEAGALSMDMGGFPLTLNRTQVGPSPKVSPPGQAVTPPAAAPQGAPRPAANDPLSRLLLSSAWCSFTYNKVTGASSSSRYQFFPNGSWNNGGRSETYNSGANGSVAGQYDSANGGRWEVRSGQLWMSTPQAPVLQPVGAFSVTRNSSGYPIINANGQEFSSCN
jgi:hypothetical protein